MRYVVSVFAAIWLLSGCSTPGESALGQHEGDTVFVSLDLSAAGIAEDLAGDQLVAVASVDGSLGVFQSSDATNWSNLADVVSGLPSDLSISGLRRFGDGYIIAGSVPSPPDDTMIGPEPFVALSDDLIEWRPIEMFGIDQPMETPPRGDIGDSLAVFVGFSRLFEAGVGGRVTWILRPGDDPTQLDDDQFVGQVAVVGDTAVAIRSDGTREFALARLDGDNWTDLPAGPTSRDNVPTLFAVRGRVFMISSGEFWASDDLGQTWHSLPRPGSEIRFFGTYHQFGIAGPAEPTFGTPDHFKVSTDGENWKRVPLPDGATAVDHLVFTEARLLSLVEMKAPQEPQLIVTPLG